MKSSFDSHFSGSIGQPMSQNSLDSALIKNYKQKLAKFSRNSRGLNWKAKLAIFAHFKNIIICEHFNTIILIFIGLETKPN